MFVQFSYRVFVQLGIIQGFVVCHRGYAVRDINDNSLGVGTARSQDVMHSSIVPRELQFKFCGLFHVSYVPEAARDETGGLGLCEDNSGDLSAQTGTSNLKLNFQIPSPPQRSANNSR